MEIILDNIEEKFKKNITTFILSMVKIVFQSEDIYGLRRIHFHENMIEMVKRYYLKKYGQQYIPSEYGDLRGKVISVNGLSDVYIDNRLFLRPVVDEKCIDELFEKKLIDEKGKNLLKELFHNQLKTLHHELIHAQDYNNYYKIYKDFNNYKYPIDVSIFQQSFNLWSEYSAVKKTSLKFYHESDLKDFDTFYELISDKYILQLDKIRKYVDKKQWKDIFISSILYISELCRFFSYVLGIMDAMEIINKKNNIEGLELFKENFIQILKANCMGEELLKIWKILKDVDTVIMEKEVVNIGKYLELIYRNNLKIKWLREDNSKNPYWVGLN
ncbi:hypothetical protein [Clostridium scatologenes]|uniref:Uncharacterized protein n=1 Tax=Clostridium scatologenes TaxID=1548 RepID=A0A0E3GSF0_CLOSL|nr:hypothetical protein [Clostridium scatologenes]AKA71956.1 hypothetical protein CSCA_4831 [Clostridium scatologenes]